MLKLIYLFFILLSLILPLSSLARERHIHSSAGLGGSGLTENRNTCSVGRLARCGREPSTFAANLSKHAFFF
jgi:hypothetical protein